MTSFKQAREWLKQELDEDKRTGKLTEHERKSKEYHYLKMELMELEWEKERIDGAIEPLRYEVARRRKELQAQQ